MKILITGAGGQLGNEMQRILRDGAAEIGPIPADYADAQVIAGDIDVLDITDEAAVSDFLESYGFDLIINCAGVTNVDGCEVDEDTAYAVNATAVGNLAKAAAAVGAKLVQVSTDYVFSGDEAGERVESDKTNPLSAYGRTKLAGEQLAIEYCAKSFVVRTAWLYGYVGKNFVKTMMQLGETHDKITVVDDQLGNPTSANDLAYEILRIAVTDNYGIYHCTNKGTCSWATFAQAIMNEAGLDCAVVPCTSAEYKEMNLASASRPAFSSLKNKHLEETVGDQMRPWEQALESYFKNLPLLEG